MLRLSISTGNHGISWFLMVSHGILMGYFCKGEPCIKRQIIPDCGCKVAEESFAKFSGEPWTIKKLVG